MSRAPLPPTGPRNSRPVISFPLHKAATANSKGKVVSKPSPLLRTVSEKRKRSCDEDDEEDAKSVGSLDRKQVLQVGIDNDVSMPPTAAAPTLDLPFTKVRTIPSSIAAVYLSKSSAIPSNYYIKCKTITNQHTIPLSVWDDQVREHRSAQTDPSEIRWIHKSLADVGPRKQQERYQWVNLIADVTKMPSYNYFLCIPCERRPDFLPQNPRDASCELLKTVRVCLLRKIKSPELKARFEKDAEIKAVEDVKKYIVAGSASGPLCSSDGVELGGHEASQPSSCNNSSQNSEIKTSDRQEQQKHIPTPASNSPDFAKARPPLQIKTSVPPSPTSQTNFSPSPKKTSSPSNNVNKFSSNSPRPQQKGFRQRQTPSPVASRFNRQSPCPSVRQGDVPRLTPKRNSATAMRIELELGIIEAQRAQQQAKRADMQLLEQERKMKLQKHLLEEGEAGGNSLE